LNFLFACNGRAGHLGSEAILPAHLIGMVLAGTAGRDHLLIRRLRTLTIGLLTPFYFIRAGYLVSIPAIVAAPAAFFFLLMVEAATKIASVYPVARYSGSPRKDAIYTTLLLSDWPDFWDDNIAIWLVARDYRQEPIFHFGSGNHRNRNYPCSDCQYIFFPAPFVCRSGAGTPCPASHARDRGRMRIAGAAPRAFERAAAESRSPGAS
jgi:Sodium/hydrogen exchanger family